MLKYFCDGCNKEIPKPTAVSTRDIATIEFLNPITGKQDTKMLCADCTIILAGNIKDLQKKNGVTNIDENLSIKIK